MNIEYELQKTNLELNDVVITIPIPYVFFLLSLNFKLKENFHLVQAQLHQELNNATATNHMKSIKII